MSMPIEWYLLLNEYMEKMGKDVVAYRADCIGICNPDFKNPRYLQARGIGTANLR